MAASPDRQDIATIADKWNRETEGHQRADRTLRTRWWQHPYVIRQVNRRLCGTPVAGWNGGMIEWIRARHGDELPFGRGVSVGGGTGGKEMELLTAGVVDEMTMYELSTVRIDTARELAASRGLTDRFHVVEGDAFELEREVGSFDLVHWDNSLHHMFDTGAAIDWSRAMLRPGGLFYMYDFVGPSRFQWTPEMLELGTAVRRALPDPYLVDPNDPSRSLSREFTRPPSIERMIEKDPSEAADSERILPELERAFPTAEIVPTGGVVYSLALNDIIHHFEWDPLDPLLVTLMLLDFQAANAGLTHYAAALATK